MKRSSVFALVFLLGCTAPETPKLYRAPALDSTVDGVHFVVGDWTPHLAAGDAGSSWGNHRAVVTLDAEQASASAVRAVIKWRRSDLDPAAKAIVVVDSESGAAVDAPLIEHVSAASGTIVFQPNPGSLTYHVYYLPWESTGGYYPTVAYQAPTLVAPWFAPEAVLDEVQATRIQSVDDFHSFFPMEVIATDSEVASLPLADGWGLFPEHRDRPIRMRNHLPHHWLKMPSEFASTALRDEVFTFQIGVFAASRDLNDMRVAFDGFPAEPTCYNCGGTRYTGEPFTKEINVAAGEVQPLWIGLQIPEDARPGEYRGVVTVSAEGAESKSVQIALTVDAARAANHGYNEPELMSRLAWLNSTDGTDPDFLIAPFEPVAIQGKHLTILGREVELGDNGLPANILSHFTADLSGLSETAEPVLAAPIALEVDVAGAREAFEAAPFEITQEARGRAGWSAQSQSDHFDLRVDGALEYDGMLDYQVALVARTRVDVDQIALPVALVPDAATYMLGLGFRGGRRPASVNWKWDVKNHQEGVWMGGIHKGLQYVLRDENYVRPLNTNFYQNQPLNLPPSWYNEGRGGIRISTGDGAVIARNYSGARSLNAGDTLHFHIRFLITPFKPVDTRTHFRTRFVHQYVPVDSVIAWGGTVVNIHHANEINPYINYPFFALAKQTAYIAEAHEKGIKVKLYDTIRELTYRAHELFALRSLGDEVFNDGEGGGHSWMQEHLQDRYHAAWHAWRVDDAALLNKGTSRWTNYYIEGLDWLAEYQHIDGLYLDDIAFSRETVKRMISVLNRHRDDVVIDLHSANQYNPRDGFINSAMLYMEHFPFISRLWFGEYFEYDRGPDYWMTEVSGLPFGLMGEMLQDGGHPYRGLLYGMTARKYGNVDPRPVWKMMDEFRIDESRMRGYWLQSPPVRTNHPGVLATTYVRDGHTLIALASWSDDDETVSLEVDWAALGLDGATTVVSVPGVDGLQAAASATVSKLHVPANQGLFVRIDGF